MCLEGENGTKFVDSFDIGCIPRVGRQGNELVYSIHGHGRAAKTPSHVSFQLGGDITFV